MKYSIYKVALLSLTIFIFTACNFSGNKQINDNAQVVEIPKEASFFEATVIEKTNDMILVEPDEMSDERKSSDCIQIGINNIADQESQEIFKTLSVGSKIKVGYTGGIAESYPAQIHHVEKIELVEKGQLVKTDYPPMVMVNGKLYKATGEESDIKGRCGVMDGEITSSVDGTQIPTQEDQSNFGTGYGYQYVTENSIDVFMPDGDGELKWMRFTAEVQGQAETQDEANIKDLPLATANTISSTNIDNLEGVSIQIIRVDNKGIELSILNRTDKSIQFGEDYLLEMKKEDGNWYVVDYIIDDWAFHSIGYAAEKDVPAKWGVDWTYFHGVLPKGNYRIVKPVMDFKKAGEFKVYNLAAEFYIKR